MRCFRADIFSESTNTHNFQSFKVLYEQLDRQAAALPHYRNGGGWFDEDDESGVPNLAIALIVMDRNVSRKGLIEILERAYKVWGIDDAHLCSIEECTLEECITINTHRNVFYEREIRTMLGLDPVRMVLHAGSVTWVYEKIVEYPSNEQEALELASKSKHSLELTQEIDRIFHDAKCAPATLDFASNEPRLDFSNRLPIHYVIEGGSVIEADNATSILLGALLRARRIDSQHVYVFNFDESFGWLSRDDEQASLMLTEQLIKILDGNVLVVRYGELESMSSYHTDSYLMLVKLLELINRIDNRIQLVFQVPREKSEVIRRLKMNFEEPLVVIGCDKGESLSALDFKQVHHRLTEKAQAEGLESIETLKPFLSRRFALNSSIELEAAYEEWKELVQSRTLHPAYAQDINESLLEKPKGNQSALARLDELVGLEKAKSTIRSIIKRARMNSKLREQDLPVQEFSMNMVFSGSPGTGKTEVARLYAEILKEVGILKEGRLVCRSGAESFNVEDAFVEARGSVLFIDEAYGLLGSLTSITSLIAHMENYRNETVVILAGYKGHMNALIDSNPGFRSRIGFTIDFSDYKSSELLQIFDLMCRRSSLRLDEEARNAVRDAIERCGKRADHGNARYIRNLYETIVGVQQERLADMQQKEYSSDLLTMVIRDDVERATKMKSEDDVSGRERLGALIGLTDVKKMVSSRLDFCRMNKVKRDAGIDTPQASMHFAFKGSPGTGKTEVARLIGRILREEGVLSIGEFYELNGHDLVASFPGGSGEIVEDLFAKARGSVVFIDEAYSLLSGGSRGDEAIAAIIAQMENLRDEVVVIFAGYSNEIDTLFDANPGFASRVKTHIEFPDYSADELVQIFHKMASDQSYLVRRDVDKTLKDVFIQACNRRNFGNARFARNLLENAAIEQSVRLAGEVEKGTALSKRRLLTLLARDIEAAGRDMSKGDDECIFGFVA